VTSATITEKDYEILLNPADRKTCEGKSVLYNPKYSDKSITPKPEMCLTAKFESDCSVGAIVTRFAEFGSAIKAELEKRGATGTTGDTGIWFCGSDDKGQMVYVYKKATSTEGFAKLEYSVLRPSK